MASSTQVLSWLTRRGIRNIKVFLFLLGIAAILLLISLLRGNATKTELSHLKQENLLESQNEYNILQTDKLQTSKDHISIVNTHYGKIKVTMSKVQDSRKLDFNRDHKNEIGVQKKPKPCYNVHAFYYPWYGNPKFDKKYLHWNHRYLPHWSPNIAKMYPAGVHEPPNNIGSNFFPELEAYSSRDPSVIENHMQQISFAGIGVIAVSYYPQGQADDNGEDWQDIFPDLLDIAHKYQIKIAFHIEPYKDRSEMSVKSDIEFILDSYGTYPAFYRYRLRDQRLPLIYIYDSYHTKTSNWAKILKGGPESVRGTKYNAIVIGLVVTDKDKYEMVLGGFDGFYTYFAADGFTFGSTRRNWDRLSEFAKANDLLYIPSVGPGYVDTRVRPWNGENTRHRLKGKYYSESWNTALQVNPDIISITSFNEWHEGTQIEKAIPMKAGSFTYMNYQPSPPNFYLSLTKMFVKKLDKCLHLR